MIKLYSILIPSKYNHRYTLHITMIPFEGVEDGIDSSAHICYNIVVYAALFFSEAYIPMR